MKSPTTNYLYRALLCIIVFILTILSAYQYVDQSIDRIIIFAGRLEDSIHIFCLFFIPVYLAVIIFGFGILSIYCATKIEQLLDQ